MAGIAFSAVAAKAVEPEVPAAFPSHPPSLAKEMVGVAHRDPERVKELLSIRPTLANAAWDWGFGDWETALGAASHVGRRDIAEMLLANGAHPTIFSATMLGQLDVVKAMIVARPGVQRTLGPHSISLLAHARAGGDASLPVFRYLQELGDAGGLGVKEISEEELDKLIGEYGFGDGGLIRISKTGKQLSLTRTGGDSRPIHHIGDHLFRPAGASAVRIDLSDASVMTIRDGDLVVRAIRREWN